MGFIRRHLSYANIAATLALVLAMSGGALAATRYHVASLIMWPSGAVIDPETPVPPGVYYLLDGITWNLN